MDVEIHVDQHLCIGSGQCVHFAGGVFDQDDDAKAFVVDPRGEPEDRIVQAVVACPMQAITLHVGDAVVGPRDLQDWTRGIHSDDPIVEVLGQLSHDHHELRTALSDQGPDLDDARARELCSLTTDHLRDEEETYSAIAALVGPSLVDSFEDDHSDIERALAAVADHDGDAAARQHAVRHLATVVDDHIRLEETVLFPAALAALASGARAIDTTAS